MRTMRAGLFGWLMIALSGCQSTPPIVAECPRFVRSPEAAERQIQRRDWVKLKQQMQDTYTTRLKTDSMQQP